MSSTSANSVQTHSLRFSMIMLFAFAIMALFGAITIQHAFAISSGELSWSTKILYQLLPEYANNETGMISSRENEALYRTEFLKTMSSHTVLGGMVMILGSFQFIPSLRRKYRHLHRASGALLVLGMLTVSISAVNFLTNTQPEKNIGGTPFWFLLFGLSGFSLWFLAQAALAAFQKKFREHMIWMGLAFSCYLTAPALRLNYLVVGLTDPQNINRLVPNSASTVLLQTIILFALWFVYVGDKDIPSKKPVAFAPLHQRLLAGVMAVSIASLAGLLIAIGLADSTPIVQTSGSQWIVALGLFGSIRLAHMVLASDVWKFGLVGNKPSISYAIVTIMSAAISLYVVGLLNLQPPLTHMIYYAITGLAIIELVLLALSYATPSLGSGVNLFSLFSSGTAWFWGSIPGLFAVLYIVGFPLEVAVTVAFLLSLPMGIVVAFIVGANLSLLPVRNFR